MLSLSTCQPSYPQPVIRPVLVQVVIDLVVVLTHVHRIPPIAAIESIRKRRLGAFQGDVPAAHDAQAEVLEAVLQMERHLRGEATRVIGCDGSVDGEDVVLRTSAE